MEQNIRIAEKLYECRDSARFLHGEKYKEKIQWYKDVICNAQKKWKKDVLNTVTELCKMSSVEDNGIFIMMFMAAAVELIEPIDEKPQVTKKPRK